MVTGYVQLQQILPNSIPIQMHKLLPLCDCFVCSFSLLRLCTAQIYFFIFIVHDRCHGLFCISLVVNEGRASFHKFIATWVSSFMKCLFQSCDDFLLNWVVCLTIYSSFIYFGLSLFFRWKFCKYCLPLCSFCFLPLNAVFWWIEILHVSEIEYNNIFLLVSVLVFCFKKILVTLWSWKYISDWAIL